MVSDEESFWNGLLMISRSKDSWPSKVPRIERHLEQNLMVELVSKGKTVKESLDSLRGFYAEKYPNFERAYLECLTAAISNMSGRPVPLSRFKNCLGLC